MESRFLGDTKLVVLDRVWAIIRDFNEFPSWHSEVATALLKTAAERCGRLRAQFVPEERGYFRERLLTLSDREYIFTYTILESPLPMTYQPSS